jgi:hypothetical protein
MTRRHAPPTPRQPRRRPAATPRRRPASPADAPPPRPADAPPAPPTPRRHAPPTPTVIHDDRDWRPQAVHPQRPPASAPPPRPGALAAPNPRPWIALPSGELANVPLAPCFPVQSVKRPSPRLPRAPRAVTHHAREPRSNKSMAFPGLGHRERHGSLRGNLRCGDFRDLSTGYPQLLIDQ